MTYNNMDIKLNQLAQEVFLNKYSYLKSETIEQTIERYTKSFIDKEIQRFSHLYEKKARTNKDIDNSILFGLSPEGFNYYSILLNVPTFDYGCVKAHVEKFVRPLFESFKIIPGGSVIEGVGLDLNTSLSNCFVNTGPEDSIESIYKVCSTNAQLMKRRGGVGHDLSNIRPKGAFVNNAARISTGVVPFMDLYSNSTKIIAQDGRRGALLLSLSIVHPDSEDFIKSKQDLCKITAANISVKIPNSFMEAVEKDEDYLLKYPITQDLSYFTKEYLDCPYNTLTCLEDHKNNNKVFYIKKVKAKELWNTLIQCAWKTAEPGILFEDNHIEYSPDGVYEQYRMISTNPCGEIGMQPFDSCRLIHHNYLKLIKEINGNINDLYKVFYLGMILGDILVDLELDAIQKIISKLKESDPQELELWMNIYKTTKNSRRAGVGFMGLWDVLLLSEANYTDGKPDMEKMFRMANYISKTKLRAELDASIDMAIIYGPFKGWNPELELVKDDNSNKFYSMVKEDFPHQYQRMMTCGRRNVSFNTVAPTGTVSMMADTTPGIEPLFLPYYQRKVKVNDDSHYDFQDITGEKFRNHIVIHGPLLDWITTHFKDVIVENLTIEEIEKYFKLSPYYGFCSHDISIEDRLRMQATIQRYVTHSISSTVNLSKDVTPEQVSTLYLKAHNYNLKGITIYRDGSRDGILNSINNIVNTTFNPTDAIPRPKELPADLHIVTVKGNKYAVLVGLLDNNPYEVFAISIEKHLNISSTKGKIVKVGKSKYSFISDIINIENLQLQNNQVEEKAFTIMVSMLLRSRNKISHILKTMNKIDDNISSFSRAIQRILSKYIPAETIGEVCPECGSQLVRENGCIHCLSCSYSKC